MHVHGPRTTGHALADREGRRLPPRGGGGARARPCPVTVFLGGPPALILSAIAPLPENVPELMLASLLAGRQLATRRRARRRIRSLADAEFALIGDVPPGRAPPGGALRRPLRLLLARARLPRVRGRTRSPTAATRSTPPRWWASRARRTSSSATSCRSCSRRSSRWSCRRCETSVVVRRDRLPLAGGGGGEAALPPRGDGERVPHPRRGPALADQVPAGHRPPGRPAGFPRHARARPGADAIPRPTSTSSRTSSMDTLDYTGPRVNEGSKGVLARPRATPCASCRGSSGASEPPAGRRRRPRLLRRLPGGGRAALRRRARRPRSASPPHPAFAGWPLLVLSDEPRRRRWRAPTNFLWTTFTRFEPAADIHAAGVELFRHHPVLPRPRS